MALLGQSERFTINSRYVIVLQSVNISSHWPISIKLHAREACIYWPLAIQRGGGGGGMRGGYLAAFALAVGRKVGG